MVQVQHIICGVRLFQCRLHLQLVHLMYNMAIYVLIICMTWVKYSSLCSYYVASITFSEHWYYLLLSFSIPVEISLGVGYDSRFRVTFFFLTYLCYNIACRCRLKCQTRNKKVMLLWSRDNANFSYRPTYIHARKKIRAYINTNYNWFS